jgi:5'-nucleotidase
VLVTNDDGIEGEGLGWLAAVAAEAGFDVLVAAPAAEASGSGAAMTAVQQGARVKIERRELPGAAAAIPAYAVWATPAFIAFTAVRGVLGFRPRFVLSGINRGPNTGHVVLHSGTVGAALTAAAQGVTAAAFSLDARHAADHLEWSTGALVAAEVIRVLPDVTGGIVLNVNVPNLPPERLRGIRRARLAAVGAVHLSVAPPDEGYLEVGLAGPPGEPEPGSDSAVLAAGFASVTPLHAVCEAPADGLRWPAASAVTPVTPATPA